MIILLIIAMSLLATFSYVAAIGLLFLDSDAKDSRLPRLQNGLFKHSKLRTEHRLPSWWEQAVICGALGWVLIFGFGFGAPIVVMVKAINLPLETFSVFATVFCLTVPLAALTISRLDEYHRLKRYEQYVEMRAKELKEKGVVDLFEGVR
jgi:hypothetical protein